MSWSVERSRLAGAPSVNGGREGREGGGRDGGKRKTIERSAVKEDGGADGRKVVKKRVYG